MKTFKATIIPTISGGNIEVTVSANNEPQAAELIKTLPYFKSFAKSPTKVETVKLNQAMVNELAELQYNKNGLEIKELIELGNIIMFNLDDAIYYNMPIQQ